ncbi:MAG: SCO family protein [Gammaproteobacteria bacterium]|nr:SCO family protein [Gammaproteobacteria bacterium]
MPPSRVSRRTTAGVLIAAALIGLLAGLWLAGGPPGRTLNDLHATLLPEPRAIGPFELVDHHGNTFTAAHLRGKWTFVFLGYTHCPDVCLTTLTTLDRISDALAGGPLEGDTLFLFVSVDPRRDDPARLAEYVAYFNEGFIGATGIEQELRSLAARMAVPYRIPADADPAAGYTVDHSASVMLLGPAAGFHAVFSAPHDAERMIADYRKIRQYRKD